MLTFVGSPCFDLSLFQHKDRAVPALGGASLNACFAAKAVNANVRFVSRPLLGDLGHLLETYMSAAGIEWLQIGLPADIPLFTCSVNSEGEASDGTFSGHDALDGLEPALEDARVWDGPLFLSSDLPLAFLNRAISVAAGHTYLLIAASESARVPLELEFKPTAIIMNHREAQILLGASDESSLPRLLQFVDANFGVALATLGSRGCLTQDKAGSTSVPADLFEESGDWLGAGDVVAGAFAGLREAGSENPVAAKLAMKIAGGYGRLRGSRWMRIQEAVQSLNDFL